MMGDHIQTKIAVHLCAGMASGKLPAGDYLLVIERDGDIMLAVPESGPPIFGDSGEAAALFWAEFGRAMQEFMASPVRPVPVELPPIALL